jgi:hypothetical protein
MNSLSPPASPMPGPGNIMQAAQQAHMQAVGLFDQTGKFMAHIQNMSQELASLSKLGDSVTAEDVIQTAGRLVAGGAFTPGEAAAILSDMPTSGGQALASWVGMHLQQNLQTAQQVAQVHSVARHEMGISGLRLLQMDHQGQLGRQPQPTASPSALEPGTQPEISLGPNALGPGASNAA